MPPSTTHISVSEEVQEAIDKHLPIVALESTVITHGLPRPDNLNLAQQMESTVRDIGACPATIALLDGKIQVGLSPNELEYLANAENVRKISRRDFAGAITKKQSGGTTVAGSLLIAEMAGIRTFATGGIGGVHRFPPFDISTDLIQLSNTPAIVVCAGAKSILDLPATLEYLETLGVPVIGYQTDEFPAFHSRTSGLPVSEKADSPEEITDLALAHWGLGIECALLVAVPPPAESAIPFDEIESHINTGIADAQKVGIRGQAMTPYLLQRLSELTEGESIKTNISLLLNNARVASEIAISLASQPPA